MNYAWFAALQQAMKNNPQPQSRYAQLATIGLDGSPRSRTLVFRGFQAATESPLFVTDNRSDKVRELARDDRCEAVWYFADSWEQFRLRGRMRCYSPSQDNNATRAAFWQQLSESVREQFYWPSPGAVLDSTQKDASVVRPDPTDPPESFTLLALSVSSVDHLQLRPKQRRFISDYADDGWYSREINP